MRLHHMCLITSNLQRSIVFWRDVMGYRVAYEAELPDRDDDQALCSPTLLDDCFETQGARSRIAIMIYDEGGTYIEIQEPLYPRAELTPPEQQRYRHSGVHELGLEVDDVDAMFARVKSAGLDFLTDYIFPIRNTLRSFIFKDPDGNLIQLTGRSQVADHITLKEGRERIKSGLSN